MKVAGYNDSVFINCPFDNQYTPILRGIVYTVYRCGFFPKSALDEDDGLDNRLSKIIRKIRDSRYGIHDLSRIELNAADYPRFNMPFELGIFFGARNLGDDSQKKKSALVLERTKYSYQQYISDLNGIDTKAHNNDPAIAMAKVRDWLRTASGRKTIPGYAILTAQYQEFQDHLSDLTGELGFTVDNIPFIDFLNLVEDAVREQIR
ncbi:MAG TPA: hypothetical protein VK563_01175 [Puia sp.]|nr:hypothetical protein [Puia sp.]